MKELTLKEIQSLCLSILKDIHSFCSENNIAYSLAYGSLIGAVRHKGFIPWDDDIDIVMPRPDYERFISTYKSSDYELSTPTGDSYMGFTRVYDNKLTGHLTLYPWSKKENVGIAVDIFPLDGVSENADEFMDQVKRAHMLYLKSIKKRTSFAKLATPFKFFPFGKALTMSLKILCKRILFSIWNIDHVQSKYLKLQKEIAWGATSKWSNLSCVQVESMREYNNMADVESFQLVDFEDTKVYIMSGYDNVLRNMYGDYMTIPKNHEQHTSSHTKYFWK